MRLQQTCTHSFAHRFALLVYHFLFSSLELEAGGWRREGSMQGHSFCIFLPPPPSPPQLTTDLLLIHLSSVPSDSPICGELRASRIHPFRAM